MTTDLWRTHKILSFPRLCTLLEGIDTILFYGPKSTSSHHLSPSFLVSDPYHAYRNLETNSLQDSNNINQNFSSQPYFDFSVSRNVTTRVGQTAFLNCRVKQLGDKLVSFICKWETHYGLNHIFQFSRALLRLSIDVINMRRRITFFLSPHRYLG